MHADQIEEWGALCMHAHHADQIGPSKTHGPGKGYGEALDVLLQEEEVGHHRRLVGGIRVQDHIPQLTGGLVQAGEPLLQWTREDNTIRPRLRYQAHSRIEIW